jgi:CheY-like chemotaxis protein
VKSILFVEDHLGLIEELVRLILREVPADKLVLRFATDAQSAMECLEERKEGFDAVVLDTMLPAIPEVPPMDEGIFFGAWLFGEIDHLPDSLKNSKRPSWLTSLESPKNMKLVFLTSRDIQPVKEQFQHLTGKKYDDRVQYLERLRMMPDEQAKIIIEFLSLPRIQPK